MCHFHLQSYSAWLYHIHFNIKINLALHTHMFNTVSPSSLVSLSPGMTWVLFTGFEISWNNIPQLYHRCCLHDRTDGQLNHELLIPNLSIIISVGMFIWKARMMSCTYNIHLIVFFFKFSKSNAVQWLLFSLSSSNQWWKLMGVVMTSFFTIRRRSDV